MHAELSHNNHGNFIGEPLQLWRRRHVYRNGDQRQWCYSLWESHLLRLHHGPLYRHAQCQRSRAVYDLFTGDRQSHDYSGVCREHELYWQYRIAEYESTGGESSHQHNGGGYIGKSLGFRTVSYIHCNSGGRGSRIGCTNRNNHLQRRRQHSGDLNAQRLWPDNLRHFVTDGRNTQHNRCLWRRHYISAERFFFFYSGGDSNWKWHVHNSHGEWREP